MPWPKNAVDSKYAVFLLKYYVKLSTVDLNIKERGYWYCSEEWDTLIKSVARYKGWIYGC